MTRIHPLQMLVAEAYEADLPNGVEGRCVLKSHTTRGHLPQSCQAIDSID
jgi:hypothetical protein